MTDCSHESGAPAKANTPAWSRRQMPCFTARPSACFETPQAAACAEENTA